MIFGTNAVMFFPSERSEKTMTRIPVRRVPRKTCSNSSSNSAHSQSTTTSLYQRPLPIVTRRPLRTLYIDNSMTLDSQHNDADSNVLHNNPPTPELYNLIRTLDYRHCVPHCRRNPQDARWMDAAIGQSPLMLACMSKPPARVIQALLQAYPHASRVPCTLDGSLPLHMACRYNASFNVIKVLLQQDPTTAMKRDRHNQTPLHALRKSNMQATENYASMYWKTVELVLQAIAKGQASNHKRQHHHQSAEEPLLLLHAAVALNCPAAILDFCLSEYNHEINQTDALGRLPLHVALDASSECTTARSPVNATVARTVAHPQHDTTACRLLERYPHAARVQDPTLAEGRFPLHSALLQNYHWTRGIKDLIDAAPDVLLRFDPGTGLLPFLLSVNDLNTTFRLLRLQPVALQLQQHAKDDDTSSTLGC
jgi:hypothetical protein